MEKNYGPRKKEKRGGGGGHLCIPQELLCLCILRLIVWFLRGVSSRPMYMYVLIYMCVFVGHTYLRDTCICCPVYVCVFRGICVCIS